MTAKKEHFLLNCEWMQGSGTAVCFAVSRLYVYATKYRWGTRSTQFYCHWFVYIFSSPIRLLLDQFYQMNFVKSSKYGGFQEMYSSYLRLFHLAAKLVDENVNIGATKTVYCTTIKIIVIYPFLLCKDKIKYWFRYG